MAHTLATNYCNSCFFLIKRPHVLTHSFHHHHQQQQDSNNSNNSLIQDSVNSNSLIQDSIINNNTNSTNNNNNNTSNNHHNTSNNHHNSSNNNNNHNNNNNNHNNNNTNRSCCCCCSVTATASLASPAAISTNSVEVGDVITPGTFATTPDLTTAYDTRRFFISSPGQSNTIIDSLPPSFPASVMEAAEVAGGVPVLIYSGDPYMEFRRSMQEMVEARDLGKLKVKQVWEYLQELLLTYLALNPNNTHKYIVGAFTDLIISIMSPTHHNHNYNHNHNHNHNLHHPSSSSA